MFQPLIVGLLVLSGTAFAGSPARVETQPLVKSKPGSQLSSELRPQAFNNATLLVARDLNDFNLFARQTCSNGGPECDSGLCCDPGQNCVENGCCDQPMIECGADACYDPETETCCEQRGTTCDIGYECVDPSGCCRTGYDYCNEDYCYDPETEICCADGTKCDLDERCVSGGRCCPDGSISCGDDSCYDPDFSICCTDGGDAWSCSKGERCCASSQSCYDPDTEKCCPSGACFDSGSCCDIVWLRWVLYDQADVDIDATTETTETTKTTETTETTSSSASETTTDGGDSDAQAWVRGQGREILQIMLGTPLQTLCPWLLVWD
ncbi:hypothetical protein B0J13DRAFT_632271 [Dactylonectria estremocensis]|uniref:Disintegrin domain-containing protein n=1 Tax=Dactylonectria estremocensis TaxID=1079267 RepID=A0A9P9CYB7_9HYPO|nr:hypothetical protein B0J13DRAFT_632271 [Dactylonectria estremocensis]